jgi:hypothetical protein
MGLLEGMLDLVPSARVSHIGLYREPESLVAVEYYFKAPTDLGERLVIAVDPMLATGNTAIAAVDRLKEHGANDFAVSSEWLHGDFLQQIERQLLSGIGQRGHLEGGSACVADACLAGVAHDGGEILEQRAKAVHG